MPGDRLPRPWSWSQHIILSHHTLPEYGRQTLNPEAIFVAMLET